MKYRKCLWCGDFFWAYYTEKTCSEDCKRLRTNEKAEKARKKRVAKEKAIRAKLEKKFVTAPRVELASSFDLGVWP